MKSLRVTSQKGFSLIEVLVVVLSLMLMFYFIYNFLSQTQRLVSDNYQNVSLVDRQIDLYESLLTDLNNSFMSRDADHFLKDLTVYEDGRFRFYSEFGSGQLEGVSGAGIYEVSYYLSNGVIERRVKIPSGVWGHSDMNWVSYENLSEEQRRNDSLVPRVFLNESSDGLRVVDVSLTVNGLEQHWTYPIHSVEVLVTYDHESESRQFLHKFSL